MLHNAGIPQDLLWEPEFCGNLVPTFPINILSWADQAICLWNCHLFKASVCVMISNLYRVGAMVKAISPLKEKGVIGESINRPIMRHLLFWQEKYLWECGEDYFVEDACSFEHNCLGRFKWFVSDKLKHLNTLI